MRGFDPYAFAPKQPADDDGASNDTDGDSGKSKDEAPSGSGDETPSRDDVVARARRVLAETSPKLAAPSPVGRRDGDADDSRVLRAVAALHARGRHAELARDGLQLLLVDRGDPGLPVGAGDVLAVVEMVGGDDVASNATQP